MLSIDQTKLEVFGFSEEPGDMFYCLLDNTSASSGIDLDKLSATKPERLDEALNKMGCLVLLSRKDLDKVMDISELEHDELHERIYEWASSEDMV